MPLQLAPNERLTGTPEQRQQLKQQLTAIRTAPAPADAHPQLSCIQLSTLIGEQTVTPGIELFLAGAKIAQRRYKQLGLTHLLPPERVWIGTASRDASAFGGCHYPGQGYRHWQMAAIITRYGQLKDRQPFSSPLAGLDLLRAYAHDCLHYGSYRVYQCQPAVACQPRIASTRYGINFRTPDGRTYSAPDEPGSATTRNLGIVMEGATDKEARSITSQTAEQAGMLEPSPGPDRFEYRDATGSLAPADCRLLEDLSGSGTCPATADLAGFLARMARYQRNVGSRYETFLSDFSPGAPDEFHALILTAMITGSLRHLCQWLSHHHGPAAFSQIFKNPSFNRAARNSRAAETPETEPAFATHDATRLHSPPQPVCKELEP